MNHIVSDKHCVACSACKVVCPRKAITLITDKSGFLMPDVNENRCIECGKCLRYCQKEQPIRSKMDSTNCYAGWSLDQEDYFESASAGVATCISKQFIRNGGIVCGCILSEQCIAEHTCIDNLNDIEKLKKSKYVHSNIEKALIECKKHLIDGKKVLFIGVPCQCAAIQMFCNYHENLYLIDLLCRGGASPVMLAQHLVDIEHKIKKTIDDITFRGGHYDCMFTAYSKKNIVYQKGQLEDEYFLGFMKHVLYRESCFECKYAGAKRIGDLTLGDFWGISKTYLKEKNLNHGVNLVFVNSEKGHQLVAMSQGKLVLESKDSSNAILHNSTLKEPTAKPEEQERFLHIYQKNGFHKAIHSIYKKDYKKLRIRKVKGFLYQCKKRVLHRT